MWHVIPFPNLLKRHAPILPTKPSASAQAKKRSHEKADGLPVHSFESLLSQLASRAKITYKMRRDDSNPTPLHARAYELIRTFLVTGN